MAAPCRGAAFLAVLFAILATARSEFLTYYMDKKEGASVSADSVRVETSLTRVYQANVKASVTVTASSGFPVLTAFFRRFDLEKVKADGTCYDYFNIYDGSSVSSTRLNAKPLCGNSLSVKRYTSSGRTMTFEFVTDGTAEMTGVEVIVTSAIKGACTDSKTQFQCTDKTFCIAASLRCESYKHCADGSDEATTLCAAIAAETNSILYGIIIGSIVGGSALIILFVFLIYYCVREHKYRRLLAQLRLERQKKNQVGPVVENEYPVTNRYRKHEFKAMFRNEDIENKDWGLYHTPLFDPAHLKKAREAQRCAEEQQAEEKNVENPDANAPGVIPAVGGDESEQTKEETNDEEKKNEEQKAKKKEEEEKKKKETDDKKKEKGEKNVGKEEKNEKKKEKEGSKEKKQEEQEDNKEGKVEEKSNEDVSIV